MTIKLYLRWKAMQREDKVRQQCATTTHGHFGVVQEQAGSATLALLGKDLMDAASDPEHSEELYAAKDEDDRPFLDAHVDCEEEWMGHPVDAKDLGKNLPMAIEAVRVAAEEPFIQSRVEASWANFVVRATELQMSGHAVHVLVEGHQP